MKKIDISLLPLSSFLSCLCQILSEDTLSTYPLFSPYRHLTNIVFLLKAHCSSRSFYFIDLFFISRVVEQDGRAKESRKREGNREEQEEEKEERGKRGRPMHFFPITPIGFTTIDRVPLSQTHNPH